MLQKIDEWIMSRIIEPLLWRIQWHTGLSQKTIVSQGYRLAGVLVAAVLFTTGEPAHRVRDVMLGCIVCGISFALAWMIQKIPLGEGGHLNPFRYEWPGRCMALLVFSFVTLIVFQVSAQKGCLVLFVFSVFHCVFCFMQANSMPPWYRQKREEEQVMRVAKLGTAS